MIQKFFFILALLFFSSNVDAQNTDAASIKKIADEVLVNSAAYSNLRYLTKDIGPRLSGSANAQKAVEATALMLKEAGADTVYLQPCMVPHWVRGAKETGFIKTANGTKYNLKLTSLGNAVGTGKAGVSSEVIEVRSMAELHQLGEKNIEGKIIFFNIPMNPTYVRTFRAYGEAGVGRRTGPSQAAKYGAIGVMVRSLASNIDEFPHTGATQYNDSFPKIPAVAISTKDAEWLSMQLRKDLKLTASFKTNCEMLPDVLSYNVVGEIRGSVYPEQILTVGGHLDSWDICEGAHDDGAGCVQSIETIRAIKALGMKPKRTIRAVMFMNEENGLRGGRAYLQQAKEKKEQHVFAMESDAGGFSPRGFGLDMTEEKQKKIMEWKPLFYEYGVYDFAPGGGGADINPLKELGTALAGLSPDSQRYFDLHHARTDTFEAVSKRELDLGAVNMAALIWLVSEYGL
ncbi:MAG: M20/M25/M40 family metallo-hydrolase [Gloeobacteraceae cyanobacterium ES-bin-316]|nr:M20/M25/M40 family metallo-hydrolase [Ferruginibacter sp.]